MERSTGSSEIVIGLIDGPVAMGHPDLARGKIRFTVVLQVSKADKFVAERLSCVLRLPSQKGCR
jgi:hypothetical protein